MGINILRDITLGKPAANKQSAQSVVYYIYLTLKYPQSKSSKGKVVNIMTNSYFLNNLRVNCQSQVPLSLVSPENIVCCSTNKDIL